MGLQTQKITLKIVDMPVGQWDCAVTLAKSYLETYPDRRGIAQCCLYSGSGYDVAVYRTATMVVVRGINGATQ